jgi:hypothetical protein
LLQTKYLSQFRPLITEYGKMSIKKTEGFGFAQIMTDELWFHVNWSGAGQKEYLAMNSLFFFKNLIFGIIVTVSVFGIIPKNTCIYLQTHGKMK